MEWTLVLEEFHNLQRSEDTRTVSKSVVPEMFKWMGTKVWQETTGYEETDCRFTLTCKMDDDGNPLEYLLSYTSDYGVYRIKATQKG